MLDRNGLMLNILASVLASGFFLSSCLAADAVDPKMLEKPDQCRENYILDASKLVCNADKTKINVPPDAEVIDSQCRSLDSYVARRVGKGADAVCLYERGTLPVSHEGDYVGDCFSVSADIKGVSLGSGGDYFVTAQDSLDKNNPKLTLVKVKKFTWPWVQEFVPIFGCRPEKGGEPVQVEAARLAESGARRRGFSYGVLTMPYKYFPGQKSFVAGLPLGGYLGWRIGQPGSSGTFALAMTATSVKADIIDPKTADQATPTITGSTDVMALSGALGFIFDVTRSPSGRAFKSGIFVGKDYVNSDPSIRYKFNRNTWVAVQFGFDFTDN